MILSSLVKFWIWTAKFIPFILKKAIFTKCFTRHNESIKTKKY